MSNRAVAASTVDPSPIGSRVEFESDKAPINRNYADLMVKFAALALCIFSIWRYAWLSDDSLITLRTALNWVHGHGPQYNPAERVVGYTHPLWFVVVSLVGLLTDSWIYAVLYTSIALAAGAVAITVFRARNAWQVATIGLVVALSSSIIDWSTSGLEGPVAALCMAVFFSTLDRGGGLRQPVLTGVVLGLLLLCRLDYVILIAPWLAATSWMWRHRWRRLLSMAAGAAIPLAIWALLTVTYYGFLLPSTFEAKTNADIGRLELVLRGTEYLRLSMGYDPTLLVFTLGFAAIALLTRRQPLVVWGSGVLLYAGYVAWVGGDYMLGRFLYVPLVTLLLALTQTDLPRTPHQTGLRRALFYAVPVGLVVLATPSSLAFKWDPSQSTTAEIYPPIVDERPGWVRMGRGLDPLRQVEVQPGIFPTDLAFLDDQARAWPTDVLDGVQPPGSVLVRCGGLGAVGFLLPSTYVIDSCGLTDRFMAAQTYTPPTDGSPWKAGHFERTAPDGYVEAVEANDPSLLRDPGQADDLARLWARIRPER